MALSKIPPSMLDGGGNLAVTGTLSSGGALSVSSGGASISGGVTLPSGSITASSGGVVIGTSYSYGWSGYANTKLRFVTSGGLAASVASGTYFSVEHAGVSTIAVSSSAILPSYDNAVSCGISGARWTVVYAATGTINTSDAREKTPVSPLTEAEITASKVLAKEIGTYRFLSAVEAKGGEARKHVGMTVQRAIAIMEAHGLNPFAYGFICFDEWDAEVDEDGKETRPAGDRFSFRPDELLMFIARGFDARLSALESGGA